MRRGTARDPAWLESQGCSLVDLTNDPGLSEGMYLKDENDHIRPKAKSEATEIYPTRRQPLLSR
jgi:hypothetical protein